MPQNGIGLPKSAGCPLIATVHDLIPYIYPETVGKKYLQKFLEEMPDIMERCARIVTVSRCSKQDIIRVFGYPQERIDVIAEAPEPCYRPISPTTARKALQKRQK